MMIQLEEAKGNEAAKAVNPGETEAPEDFRAGKVYCANCIHCKLLPAKAEGCDRYVLRIRCDAGKWRKKLGEEKTYKYCTAARRYLDRCDSYEEMGDTREFIRDLRKTLPSKDDFLPLDDDEIA